MEELSGTINTEEKLIEERKEKVVGFLKKKINWIYYIILAVILWINVKIRVLPMAINSATGNPGLWDITTNNWTLGPDLDPFLFLRYAKYIVQHGSLMAIDAMRYVPLGYETSKETVLLPYLIAYLHNFISMFKTVTVEYSAILFPVVASIFTTIFFFLLVRKIFEEKGEKFSNITALVSTALLVVLPSLLPRTIAGIPEKESVAFGLMFLAFYLFLSAWKSKTMLKAILFSVGAGIATALMALIWGGVILVYIAIAISVFIAFILDKIEKKELIVYAGWILSSLIFWAPFTTRLGTNIFASIKNFFISSSTGIAAIVLIFICVHFILFKTKLKDMKFLQKEKIKKIPAPLLSIIVAIVLFFIFSLAVLRQDVVVNTAKEVYSTLAQPYTTRLLFTVAENKQPYFSDWKASMGPAIGGIPLFFWMFFIGSIILFYEMLKKLKSKEKIGLVAAYAIFLAALIFSRNSESSSVLNGETEISKIIYFGGYLLLIACVCYFYYNRYKTNELEHLKETSFSFIFVFALIFVGVISARSGIRLIMALTPIAAIMVGYFCVESLRKALRTKEETRKIIWWIVAGIVIAATIFTLWNYYEASNYMASGSVPSAYTQQWQSAMSWVRTNTPVTAVFGHWWDYGYWLQSIGERATMLDGGNSISYWNYLMGRHGLTAESESEARELLHAHNVSYFLIDSTDVGKYSAYSSIGSDENYDRFSWIGTFQLDEKNIQETKNQTIAIYTGGASFDEDITVTDNGKQLVLKKAASGVGAIIVYKDMAGSYNQPEIVVVNKGKQYNYPLRYLFFDGALVDFGVGRANTINGCAYIFSKLGNDGSFSKAGSAMYLSPRNMRALWVKLYLLGQGDSFKLVHSELSPISKYLKANSVDATDVVYYQGVQGPIKIWKIEYRGDEKINPEYLQKDYPERIIARKYA